MAWTAPKTWSVGEVLTAANMNIHLRDNLLAVGAHLIVRKTSDQSVTSSTVLVSDTALTMAVGVSEIWKFTFHVRYEANTTADIKIAYSLPASSQIDAAASGAMANVSSLFADQVWPAITTTDASPIGFSGGGVAAPRTLLIDGTYIGGGTAGSVTLRWAQNTSDATATKVLTNSSLWAVKLA